jgi:TolB protein
VLAAVAATTANASGQRPAPSSLDRAAWLAGCWELRGPDRLTLEMWMPPFGGLMLGASRTTIGGVTREFEYLRIGARGDTLVYTAIPSGQRETEFRSTTVSDQLLTFENRAHDFPQVIIYRRTSADSIVARIEGPGPNNSTRGSNFPMRRVSCTDPAVPPPPPDSVIGDAQPSPDGRKLLIVKGVSGNWDIFALNADGSDARRLTDHAAVDYMPVWSPDGSVIAFVSAREGHQEIYTMRPDGSSLLRLTRGSAHNSQPAWSPDGRQIAFRSERGGRPQIYLMNADGSDQRALTQDSTGAIAASWSPDGKQLLFSAPRNGHSEVHVMNADGTGQKQLTTTPQGHSGAAYFSRDGRTILFWSSRDGNDEVYMMNADGSNPRNISNHPARDTPLAWSADGTYVLFRSTRDRPMNDIYRMRPDGANVTRVTTTR